MPLTIPTAYVHRTDAMRQILKLLQHNERYVDGCFDLRFAPVEAAKHEAYGAFIEEMTRYRRKKNGIANVRAVYLLDNLRVFYWLFVSEGDGLVAEIESLKNTTNKKDRVQFAGYEALRLPRQGEEGSPWTWQFRADRYNRLEEEITEAVRQKDFETIRQWSYSLKRAPSFAGVRKQAYKLAKKAEAEWQRSASGAFPSGSFAMGWQGRFKEAKQVPLYKSQIRKHLDATSVGVNADG